MLYSSKGSELYLYGKALMSIKEEGCAIPNRSAEVDMRLFMVSAENNVTEIIVPWTKRKGGVIISAHVLPAGLYRSQMVYTLTRVQNGTYCKLADKYFEGSAYFTVTQGSIYATIAGEPEVKIGVGSQIVLNGSSSFDQDAVFPNGSYDTGRLSFRWYCSVVGQPFVDRMVDTPDTAEPDSMFTPNPDGCFGTGPGWLTVPAGAANLHRALSFSSAWMAPGFVYNLTLVVTDVTDRRRHATARQLVEVAPWVPPHAHITVGCWQNCLPQVNFQQDMELYTSGPEGTTYTVLETSSSRQPPEVLVDSSTHGYHTSLLGNVLFLRISANTLLEATDYTIKIVGRDVRGRRGQATWSFSTTRSPFGGYMVASKTHTEPLHPMAVSVLEMRAGSDGSQKPDTYHFGYEERRADGSVESRFSVIASDLETVEFRPPPGYGEDGALTLVAKVCDGLLTCSIVKGPVIYSKLSAPAPGETFEEMILNMTASVISRDPQLDPIAALGGLRLAMSLLTIVDGSEDSASEAVTNAERSGDDDERNGISGGTSSGISKPTSAVSMPDKQAVEMAEWPFLSPAEKAARRNANIDTMKEMILDHCWSLIQSDSRPEILKESLSIMGSAANSSGASMDLKSKASERITMADLSTVVDTIKTVEVIEVMAESFGASLLQEYRSPRPVLVTPEHPVSPASLAAIDSVWKMRQEQDQKAKALIERQAVLTNAIVTKIKAHSRLMVNALPSTVGNRQFQVTLQKLSASKLEDMPYENPSGDIMLPLSLTNHRGSITIQIVFLASNPKAMAEADGPYAPAMMVNLVDENEKPFLIDQAMVNTIRNKSLEASLASSVDASSVLATDARTGLALTYVVTGAYSYSGHLEPSEDEKQRGLQFVVYVKLNATENNSLHFPNETHYDLKYEVNDATWWTYTIEEDTMGTSKGMYVGIQFVYLDERRKKRQIVKRASTHRSNNGTMPQFKMQVAESRCRAYDDAEKRWRSDVCKQRSVRYLSEAKCECKIDNVNVTTFSGGFKSPGTNPIDFDKIFSNFTELLSGNASVFSSVIVIIVLYIFLAVWTRWMDKKDIERWSVNPLVDNPKSAAAFYQVSVYTGMRRNAGTRSNVCIVIAGDDGNTGVRIVDDGTKKSFGRGSVRHFLMGTPQLLGDLTFCRVFHDNSGPGDFGSWFLDKIVVENLHTNERFYFLLSDWLAVDEGKQQIDRVIPAAADDDISGFQHLFFSKARKDLTDGHLWVSIASRPTKSSFTRLQRLTCAVALLFSTMVANAMFYREEDFANDVGLTVGPITVSVSTLLLSLYGTLVVIPINTIIIMLFRKAKPKDWCGSNEDETNEQDLNKETNSKKQRFWHAQYPLPHWVIYVAWAMSICTIIVAGLFIVFYSLDWGKDKSERWLSSILLSFVQSACFVQPIKVVLMACLISLIFKKLDELDDVRMVSTGAAQQDKISDEDGTGCAQNDEIVAPEPLSQAQLEEAREQREHEKKMWGIIREVTFYFLFLALVSFIAWGTQDNRLYAMNTHVHTMLKTPGDGEARIALDDVKSGFDFWNFLTKTAVPLLYHGKRYNGDMASLYDRRFLDDMYSFRVGSVRLRQNRVNQGKCDISPLIMAHSIECNVAYSMFDEDTRNFTTEWHKVRNESHTEETRFSLAWKYFSTLQLKSVPTVATLATYSGGGYVADLGVTEYHATLQLNSLQEHDWVDHYTRSVFLEFTTYNPNINLFTFVNYLFEFPPTGGVMPFTRVTSFHVYSAHGGIGKIVVAAQVIYILVIIMFIAKEIKNIISQGFKRYIRQPWNFMEVLVIAMSLLSIAMFGLREVFTRMVMESLKEDREAFTNYSALAYYDENLTYVVGILVFIANIKFLRLLRFNKHVRIFLVTLQICRKDLMYFFTILFVLLMGFSIWAYISFGMTLYGFSSFWLVIETLFSYMLGKMDHIRELGIADRYLGQIFFSLYVFVIFFICMNMFVGIICTAYAQVQVMELETEESALQVLDFIVMKLKNILGIEQPLKEENREPDDPLDVLQLQVKEMERRCTNLLILDIDTMVCMVTISNSVHE